MCGVDDGVDPQKDQRVQSNGKRLADALYDQPSQMPNYFIFKQMKQYHTCNYQVHNEMLKKQLLYTLIGIHIDCSLTWNEHVSILTNKTNSVLGFLQHNFRQYHLLK